jgi:hypothetical protein
VPEPKTESSNYGDKTIRRFLRGDSIMNFSFSALGRDDLALEQHKASPGELGETAIDHPVLLALVQIAQVGILQGAGTIAASLGLAKVFRVTEAVRMRFESTFTNVLNHTNFAPPATQIDVPSTFGVLSAPQTAENAGNRTGQLALRIEF